MDTNGYVKKQSLYLAVVAALILGFLGGIVYSVYRAPEASGDSQDAARQQEAVKTLEILEKATKDKPNDGQAWVELGHAYFDTDQAKQAIDRLYQGAGIVARRPERHDRPRCHVSSGQPAPEGHRHVRAGIEDQPQA